MEAAEAGPTVTETKGKQERQLVDRLEVVGQPKARRKIKDSRGKSRIYIA